MTVMIVVSVILLAIVIYLLYRLGSRARELGNALRGQEREWMLKIALEKTFSLPTVEAKEVEAIEKELDAIRNGEGDNAEKEEKMRQAVMELYAQKAEKAIQSAPKEETPPSKKSAARAKWD
ncbi:MAG TPA: hypothetical protein VMB24_01680 [Dehalococcoidales bacterium]|nr:hypothetical protein [Dehalococcoidales bacterium]